MWKVPRFAMDAEFEESKHPRDESGKFSSIPTKLKVGGREYDFHRNPDFRKPNDSVPLFHDTDAKHEASISKHGISDEFAENKFMSQGGNWFLSKPTWAKGDPDVFTDADRTFVAHVPKSQLKRTPEGTVSYRAIPPEYIEGVIRHKS
jgi:hypothetical protein